MDSTMLSPSMLSSSSTDLECRVDLLEEELLNRNMNSNS